MIQEFKVILDIRFIIIIYLKIIFDILLIKKFQVSSILVPGILIKKVLSIKACNKEGILVPLIKRINLYMFTNLNSII